MLKKNAVTEDIRDRTHAVVAASAAGGHRDGSKRRSSGSSRSKKAKRGSTNTAPDKDCSAELSELTVQLVIPDDLKQRLVDDADRIETNKVRVCSVVGWCKRGSVSWRAV